MKNSPSLFAPATLEQLVGVFPGLVVEMKVLGKGEIFPRRQGSSSKNLAILAWPLGMRKVPLAVLFPKKVKLEAFVVIDNSVKGGALVSMKLDPKRKTKRRYGRQVKNKEGVLIPWVDSLTFRSIKGVWTQVFADGRPL